MSHWFFDSVESGVEVSKEENEKTLRLGIETDVHSALRATCNFIEEHDIIHLKGLTDSFVHFNPDIDDFALFTMKWNNLMYIKPVGVMRS